MTIKEMIKKVNTYNNLSEEFGDRRRIVLKSCIGLGSRVIVRVNSWMEFRDYIKSEYIDVVAKMILACDQYSFTGKTEVTAVDSWGYKFVEEVEFWTEEV